MTSDEIQEEAAFIEEEALRTSLLLGGDGALIRALAKLVKQLAERLAELEKK